MASVLRQCCAFVCALTCAVLVSAADKKDPPSAANALGYGVMLYEYFQRHHFEALREYSIAEQRQELHGHGSYPKLLEGGISLAFGMDRKAENIFDELLNGSYSEGVQNQAWFYLGKIAYQRSNYERSREVLGQIGPLLPEKLQNEYRSLVSQLSLRYEDFNHAEAAFERIDANSPFKPYVNFNIGAAYQKRFIRSRYDNAETSDWYPATLKLDEAAELALRFDRAGVEGNDDEFKALADRALLAAGYALLQGKRYDAAIDRFKRVRLQGPYASQAMLGYGWAEVEQERYAEALTPWEHLIDQSLINPAVQEAYVGIPYVYEKLGAKSKALSGFEFAADKYQQELRSIEKAVQNLQSANMIELFVVEQDKGFVDWVVAQDNLVLNPQSPYLTELLAGHEFQASLTDLRDLYALQQNLETWQRKVATFQFALDSRHAAREAVQIGEKQQLLEQIATLEAARSAAYDRLSQIESNFDAIALLPEEKQGNARKSQKLAYNARELSIEQADAKPELSEKAEWAEFLAGVALWDAHEEYTENAWKIRKDLQIIDDVLEQMAQRKTSIENLLSDQLDVKRYTERIAVASEQLDTTLQANQLGINQAQRALSDLAIAKLSQHYRSIESHLAQTRLAITRLYDLNAAELDSALNSDSEEDAEVPQ
ncbi:MAG: tetratricopeptide repeat protein [Pseudomonadales bacterium]